MCALSSSFSSTLTSSTPIPHSLVSLPLPHSLPPLTLHPAPSVIASSLDTDSDGYLTLDIIKKVLEVVEREGSDLKLRDLRMLTQIIEKESAIEIGSVGVDRSHFRSFLFCPECFLFKYYSAFDVALFFKLTPSLSAGGVIMRSRLTPFF